MQIRVSQLAIMHLRLQQANESTTSKKGTWQSKFNDTSGQSDDAWFLYKRYNNVWLRAPSTYSAMASNAEAKSLISESGEQILNATPC